ncbi:MAG: methyl-accepting chemotaxis protein, partial [Leptospiraceae bacterium]|nr:methyl-accepting chemotaxis protein [Leptospiraceae bacterium]
SKGDLSKLDIGAKMSSDEFGELSAAMRELILKIRKVLFEIQKASDNLENSAQSLAENTIHFKEIVKDQKQSTDSVYEFLLELNAGITEISAESKTQFRLLSELNEKVSNLYSKIKDIEKLSQNASSSVKETQKQIEKSSSSVREMEDSIRKIGASSGEMRKIIRIIEDISNKTNLLALNAAIEAARAGDQGLGFTVVAGEVAKLSEETRRSVSNISQKLKENEEEIKTGISKVNVTVEIFNQIISSVKKIGESVNNIYQNVQTQTELNRLIENEIGKVKDKAANIQEKTSLQSRKTREAFDSIEKLKKSAEENLNGIENISSESKSLEKTSKILGDEVEFFKL